MGRGAKPVAEEFGGSGAQERKRKEVGWAGEVRERKGKGRAWA